MSDPALKPTDDRFNTISHLVGAVLALLGTAILVGIASHEHKPWQVASFCVYGVCMVALFLASTLHHGLRIPRLEHVFRKADYIAIFLLIAGSFTPICLVTVRTTAGLTVLAIVWALAVVGIFLVVRIPNLSRGVTTPMYLGMGWLALPLVHSMTTVTGPQGEFLLLAGGLCYTLGAIMLAFKFPNPLPGRFEHHEVWHVLVLMGALSHYLLMYRCVLPLP